MLVLDANDRFYLKSKDTVSMEISLSFVRFQFSVARLIGFTPSGLIQCLTFWPEGVVDALLLPKIG